MTLLRAISDAQHVWGTAVQPVAASVVLRALQDASGAEFIEGLGEKYAKRSDFPALGYVDSPEYREVRAQITSRADRTCGINDESSR